MLKILKGIIIFGLIILCIEINTTQTINRIFAGISNSIFILAFVSLLTLSSNNFFLIIRTILRGWVFKEIDFTEPLSLLVSFSEKARREGLLSLENEVAKIPDKFLQLGIQLVIDGTDIELVREILTNKKETIISSFNIPKRFFKLLRNVLLFLILSAIIIVFTLTNIDTETEKILISTILSSILFILFFILTEFRVDNIKTTTERYLNLEIEGILSVQSGDNPKIVEEKLKTLIPYTSEIIKK